MDVSYYDIERQVVSFMQEHGITPPRDGLIIDGQTHRYAVEADRHGSKSGAYCIHADGWPAGWMQDFHLGGAVKWRFEADDNTRAEWKRRAGSPGTIAARQAQKTEDEERRQEERRQAVIKAWGIYNAARLIEESPDHPYLIAKRVRPVGPLRVGDVPSAKTPGKVIVNVLLIPLFDVTSGKFMSLHRIFPWRDKETGRFFKGWYPGTSGGVFPIAGDVRRGPVFMAEGIATALSMYDLWIEEGESEVPNEYVPYCTVLACMDSGNLARQASAVRRKYADRRLLVVKDADEAGEKAARAAMEAGFDGVLEAPGSEASSLGA
jgi:putative DNA primase/helicase